MMSTVSSNAFVSHKKKTEVKQAEVLKECINLFITAVDPWADTGGPPYTCR